MHLSGAYNMVRKSKSEKPLVPRKAALYLRVSTEEQAERGASIEAQEEFLREWAAKEGFEVYKVYKDEGYSGSNMNRPSLQEMINDARKKKFQVVLCYHNDRLSRDTRDALTIVQDLLKHDVRVRFSNLDIDITTPEGEMMFTLQAAFATYFRRDLARKTKFGMQKIKKQGYWIGRIPDLFVRKNEKHTKIEPSEVVKKMKEMRDKGMSYRKIAEKISRETNKKINHVKVWRALKVYEYLRKV